MSITSIVVTTLGSGNCKGAALCCNCTMSGGDTDLVKKVETNEINKPENDKHSTCHSGICK